MRRPWRRLAAWLRRWLVEPQSPDTYDWDDDPQGRVY